MIKQKNFPLVKQQGFISIQHSGSFFLLFPSCKGTLQLRFKTFNSKSHQ